MVLTRKGCKVLGLSPPTVSGPLKQRKVQTKITQFFPEGKNEREEENREIHSVSCSLDWSLDLKGNLNCYQEESGSANLAIELASADILTPQVLTSSNKTNLPEELVKLSSPATPGRRIANEEESPAQILTPRGNESVFGTWLTYLTEDIQRMKSFLSESNKLLTILADMCKKLWLKSDTEDTNNRPNASRSIITCMGCKKARGKMITKRGATNSKKKSKNVKNVKLSRHKMQFEKLFKLLENISLHENTKCIEKPTLKKPAFPGDEMRSSTQISESKSIPAQQDTSQNSQVQTPQKPRPSNNRITGDHGWKLVLNRQKLALINCPKPVGPTPHYKRKLHLLRTLELASPGAFTLADLLSVEYLHLNAHNAHAMVTFTKRSSAERAYKCKDTLLKRGISVVRVFENCAPPLPLRPFTSDYAKSPPERENYSTNPVDLATIVSHQGELISGKNTSATELQEDISQQPMEWTQEPTGPLVPEEKNLLDSFHTLPSEIQNEIIDRLELLKGHLIKIRARKGADSKPQNGQPHTSQWQAPERISLLPRKTTLENTFNDGTPTLNPVTNDPHI